MQLVSDREGFYRLAEERERRRAAGYWREQYDPFRSRPEEQHLDQRRSDFVTPLESKCVLGWDRIRNDARFRKLVILGDPGFGKTWLMRHETVLRARECQKATLPSAYSRFARPSPDGLQDLAVHSRKSQTFEQTFAFVLESTGTDVMVTSYLQAQLRQARIALFLDAWDEIADDRERQLLFHQTKVWAQAYFGTRVPHISAGPFRQLAFGSVTGCRRYFSPSKGRRLRPSRERGLGRPNITASLSNLNATDQ